MPAHRPSRGKRCIRCKVSPLRSCRMWTSLHGQQLWKTKRQQSILPPFPRHKHTQTHRHRAPHVLLIFAQFAADKSHRLETAGAWDWRASEVQARGLGLHRHSSVALEGQFKRDGTRKASACTLTNTLQPNNQARASESDPQRHNSESILLLQEEAVSKPAAYNPTA